MKTCDSVAKIDDQITKIIQNILPTIIQEINKHFQTEYALGEDSGEQSEELNTSYVNINQISSSHAIENKKTVLEKEDLGVEERLKRKRCANPVSREQKTMEDRGDGKPQHADFGHFYGSSYFSTPDGNKSLLYGYSLWESVPFNHPSTFDSLALDPITKDKIIRYLDRFKQSKQGFRVSKMVNAMACSRPSLRTAIATAASRNSNAINIPSALKLTDMDAILMQAFDLDNDLHVALTPSQLNACSESLSLLKKVYNNHSKIYKEFDMLELRRAKGPELMIRTLVARQNGNRYKNRYSDVIPFDDTRVVLDCNKGRPCAGSDYINASYIVNPSSENLPKFIATQGPLPETSEDFWQMIIQYRCPVIVMLTQLIDNFKTVKCDDYFPVEEESRIYGRIYVTNKSLKISKNSIALRFLEVKYIESEEPPLSVLHLQYPDWPDHGVPNSTQSVRELVKRLYLTPSNLGPFVVHCSAGIGRTGAFCTVSHTIHRILEGDLSALDLSTTIRQFKKTYLLENEQSGCYALLRDYKRDELFRMYTLFCLIPEGLESLANTFQQYVTRQGLTFVEVANDDDAYQFVGNVVRLHHRFHSLLMRVFETNPIFQKALDNAFMFLYNQEIGGRTSAEFLATFYDNLLRTHGGNIWKVVELETSLLNYLGDKHNLEDFCIKKLADRLLLDKCSTIDNENKLLSHLKRELGQNFISRMESMLEDFVIADCGHLTRLVKKKDRSN